MRVETILGVNFVLTAEAPKDHIAIHPEQMRKLKSFCELNDSLDVVIHEREEPYAAA